MDRKYCAHLNSCFMNCKCWRCSQFGPILKEKKSSPCWSPSNFHFLGWKVNGQWFGSFFRGWEKNTRWGYLTFTRYDLLIYIIQLFCTLYIFDVFIPYAKNNDLDKAVKNVTMGWNNFLANIPDLKQMFGFKQWCLVFVINTSRQDR